MSKEAEIKKIGENTAITVTVKMMAWFLGLIITLITTVWGWIYVDMNSDRSTFKAEMLLKFKTLDSTIALQAQNHAKWEKEKFDPHIETANEMYKNIGIVLDRTNSWYARLNSSGTHNIESQPPTSGPPEN